MSVNSKTPIYKISKDEKTDESVRFSESKKFLTVPDVKKTPMTALEKIVAQNAIHSKKSPSSQTPIIKTGTTLTATTSTIKPSTLATAPTTTATPTKVASSVSTSSLASKSQAPLTLLPKENSTDPTNLSTLSLIQRLEIIAEKNKKAKISATLLKEEAPAPIGRTRTISSEKISLYRPSKITTPRLSALPSDGDQSRSVILERTSSISASSARRDEIKITDEEFIQLRDFLYTQSGIFLPETRKYLITNRLASRLKELGLRTFSKYYNYLCYDPNRGIELDKFFENMTTNETSFFRNNPQLDVFAQKILPKVLKERTAKKENVLNIWSAGCSSGEEPYTLAMMLLEHLKGDINKWKIKITANDLSPAVLELAKKGVYSQYTLRTTPPELIERYFDSDGKNYIIKQKVKDLVTFSQVNLSDKKQLSRIEKSHIVFCRNVIIYFDDEMKKNIISAFYDNLHLGGYLFIGHSESLHSISRSFMPEAHAGSIVYLKQS